MLDISLGGVLKFHYSTIAADQINTTNNTSDLKIGLGATIFKTVGININYAATTAQVISVMNSSINKLYTMQYFGGSTSGQTVSFDFNGNPSQTINLGNWESSISVNNCAIVDIGNALYIYDFISDPVKKAAVMTAVQRHIAAAQVTVVTPVISTWYPNTTIFSERGQEAFSQITHYQKVDIKGKSKFEFPINNNKYLIIKYLLFQYPIGDSNPNRLVYKLQIVIIVSLCKSISPRG